MAKKNLTLFQRLNNMFTIDGISRPAQSNKYSIGNDVLFKTKDNVFLLRTFSKFLTYSNPNKTAFLD